MALKKTAKKNEEKIWVNIQTSSNRFRLVLLQRRFTEAFHFPRRRDGTVQTQTARGRVQLEVLGCPRKLVNG